MVPPLNHLNGANPSLLNTLLDILCDIVLGAHRMLSYLPDQFAIRGGAPTLRSVLSVKKIRLSLGADVLGAARHAAAWRCAFARGLLCSGGAFLRADSPTDQEDRAGKGALAPVVSPSLSAF